MGASTLISFAFSPLTRVQRRKRWIESKMYPGLCLPFYSFFCEEGTKGLTCTYSLLVRHLPISPKEERMDWCLLYLALACVFPPTLSSEEG